MATLDIAKVREVIALTQQDAARYQAEANRYIMYSVTDCVLFIDHERIAYYRHLAEKKYELSRAWLLELMDIERQAA